MHYSLFLDTSLNITIGLLDDKNQWIDYIHLADKKTASKIHFLLDDLLEKNGLELEKLKELFYCSGPGSYTGMRVTEGIARLFAWQGVVTKSFYHYQIPAICGVKQGKWLANAYKGEYFIYSWSEDGHKNSELFESEAVNITNIDFYSHDPELISLEEKDTVKIIYENSDKVFNYLGDSGEALPLNYYRLPENEFKLKKKKNES